jgi:hypothetical protein
MTREARHAESLSTELRPRPAATRDSATVGNYSRQLRIVYTELIPFEEHTTMPQYNLTTAAQLVVPELIDDNDDLLKVYRVGQYLAQRARAAADRFYRPRKWPDVQLLRRFILPFERDGWTKLCLEGLRPVVDRGRSALRAPKRCRRSPLPPLLWDVGPLD